MNKFLSFLENKLAPLGEKIGTQRHLRALREGIMMAMPLVLIGSFFVLIKDFPITAWNDWLKSHWDLASLLNTMANNSFGLMALVTVFGIAYRLAESYDTDGPSSGVLALGAFLLMTPSIVDKADNLGIPYGMLGGKGIFAAIVVGMISAEIYRWFIQKKITIKMPESVPDVVSKSFSALIPGVVILILFAGTLKLIEVSGLGSLNNILSVIIGTPLGYIASTLPGTFVAVLLNSIFWFCGVNGGQVVGSVMNPLWIQYADDNRIAQAAGEVLPHIVTAPFMDLFVYIGGGGATIGLALCLLFFSKSKEYKTLGKVSGIPALFNINTAILFTFPTVLNPIMLIPFVFTPIVNAIITYFSMAMGLVPYTTGVTLPWTTPPIIGGFLATGSWQGAVLQVILVLISFMIYFPFFKAADRNNLLDESKK
ncbi:MULTISPECIES: PTS cellobiose transporter subunit IIC [Enterococcus]|uniref:Permease IIC component n=1 Tax=Enterococcus gallinarum TaxID=1353 RepID=A0ABD4ZX91_ENTGA|nr:MULTISPECIES: PTS cellobiose transporter subunit IIC [Enterococcus]MBF0825689.1 PTS cellobiose transporter subunit IIC [Enterococcus faecalis]MBA0946638.1 PTS cellobiose transporter subunit IIC [Enterococcus gallinarum]MBF0727552.1 PTS cellobiose transporter subunit IIC [Enterococcus gallinarum]MBF0799193.1 PTS cellobiose transporter subunit IIC [Enterococcus gallinarum]MCR1932744.1 PTS cellobiose transporter subunit IIC [Enterococcus gallinarum]